MERVEINDSKLAEVVASPVRVYQPERIHLFGSRARGDVGPDSDCELMVVVPDTAPPERRGSRLAYEVLWGTGTIRMAAALRQVGLPDPEFDAEAVGHFRVILRQDPFTETLLQQLGLNNRQLQAVAYIREHGEITNRDYRELTGLSDEAARKEIAQLRDRGVLVAVGKGRSTAYVLKKRVGD